MNAASFLQFFREGWSQYFGCPNVLRVDPAGAFRSHDLDRFCDEHQIYLDVVPGESHWQIGLCEQAVHGLKELMTKLAREAPEVTAEQALSEAVRTFNHREIVRGFSPAQHVLGCAPDETGRFISSLTGTPWEPLLENPDGEFQRATELRRIAEQGLVDWQASERVKRALNSRSQRTLHYHPGDLVYFWRKQTGKGNPTGKNGMFLGPARILATETRRQPDGGLRPGSAVWCVRGRRLIKCSPEQLRPATGREELVEHLYQGSAEATPWTLPRVASELGANEFDDISDEVPDLPTWQGAQAEGATAPRHRHTSKRPRDTTQPAGREKSIRSSPEGRPPSDSAGSVETGWWSDIPLEEFAPETTAHFWDDARASIEISLPMPESQRGRKQMTQDFEAFVVGSLKRRAIEINEKRLTPDELKQFQEAKGVEVRNFIAAKAFETLPPEQRPSRSQAIGMRWILTWKPKDDGTFKARGQSLKATRIHTTSTGPPQLQ